MYAQSVPLGCFMLLVTVPVTIRDTESYAASSIAPE